MISAQPLNVMETLFDVWLEGPPRKRIHIFVEVGIGSLMSGESFMRPQLRISDEHALI